MYGHESLCICRASVGRLRGVCGASGQSLWGLWGGVVPAEGPVGVDDAQRVEGRVHHLAGAHQVQHHGDAEEADEHAQRDVEHAAHQHSWMGNKQKKKRERESLRRSSRSICLHYRLDTHYTLRPDAAAASAEGAEVKQNRVIVPGWREAAGQRLFACSNYGDLERRTHSYTSRSPAQLRRQVVCLDSSRPVQVFSSSSLDRL